MKIGLVLDDTLDTPDGVQQYVLGVGNWLSTRGHEVHYLVGHTTRTDLERVHSLSRNLQVKFNGNRMSMPLPASRRKLRNFLVAQRFDVLHVQVPYSPFLAGRILSVTPDETAVVGTFHILPYSRVVTLGNRLLAIMNSISGRRFDVMVAVSQPAAEFARRIYGYQPSVVPNPVRLAQFAGVQSSSGTVNIVFLGRLVARKGAPYLLQAVAYLREHQLYEGDFRVIIGGKGALLPELERYIAAHDLGGVVSFVGFVDEADKADFLAQADIAAYPSVGGESFGIVLLEGMAAARGVVLAGDNPGYASVMEPYPDQLFDPRDTKAFAEKLTRYLSDVRLRTAAAQAQKAYVRQFDIDRVGNRLLAAYEQALQRRG